MNIPIIEVDPKIKEVYISTWDKDSTDFLVYQNETAYRTECPTRIKPVEGNAIMKFITEAGEHFILSVFEGSMAYAVSGKGFNTPVLGGEWEKVFEVGRGKIQVRYPELARAFLEDNSSEHMPHQISRARSDGAISIEPHRIMFFKKADPENRNKNKLSLYLRGLLSGKLWCYSLSQSDMQEMAVQVNRMIENDIIFQIDDASSIIVLRSPFETP